MASVPGHESCASVVPVAAPVESRYNARKIAALQWIVHRMNLDSDGVPGSYNELWRDSWYWYNAAGSYNYADSYSMSVVSVSGNEITCESSGNPLSILLFTWRERDPGGTKWITGFERHSSPQAGDVIQFSPSSKISLTCWPVITRIKSVSGNQITFETDKPMTAALSKRKVWDGSSWIDHPDPVTVRIWHHEGNPELWRYIVPPDYFYGIHKTLVITSVPADGLVELSSGPVMHPGGFYPLEPTWVLEGRRITTGEWEPILDENARLYAEGPSYVALKTVKPANGVAAPGTDLTLTYSAFRASYWEKSSGASPYCRIVGFARCKWSIPDPTGSNYGTGDGKAPGWVCLKRLVDHHDISGTTATHSSVPASGAARYPADGQCLKYNCCDQFAPAEIEDGRLTPFRYAYDAGVVIRDLLGACNQRLLRLVPRVASPSAWQAQRVKHPSLMWLVGHWGIDLPNVIDGQVARFRGYGLWGTGYYTYTDSLGNEYVDLVVGGMDGVQRTDNDGPVEDTDGNFVALGTGYTQKRNPVVPGATVIEREMERFGVAVERGSGQLRSRGIAQSSVAVAAQDIIIPDIRKSMVGPQHRGMAKYESGVVTILPLRQERKDPEFLGMRSVSSVTALSGGRVRLELDNVSHTWSFINDGPSLGDSFDQKITWWGGGGWPIMPKPSQSIESHYEPNNYTGSRAHGLWSGDTIRISGRKYVVESVEPFGGSAAPDWGGVTRQSYGYTVPSIWRPLESNLDIGDGQTGNVVITAVIDIGTMTPLVAVDSIDRPVSIPAGQYWWGEGQLLVGASVNLQIEYDVTEPRLGTVVNSYLEWAWAGADLAMQTMIPSADYISADSVAITVNGAPASPVVDTSGAYVVLTYSLLQAGLETEIVLEFDQPAPVPEDYYAYDNNYLAYGRKRDVIIAYDDSDGALAATTSGASVECYSADAVMMPGATLHWTAQGADDWQPVSAAVRHGTGEIILPPGWWDDKPEAVCFKAVGVKLMDHRGIVPASVIDKLDLIARGLVWVKCWGGPVDGDSWTYRRVVGKLWMIDRDSNPPYCTIGPILFNDFDHDSIDPFGNYFAFTRGELGFLGEESEVSIALNVSASTIFGAPQTLALLPDGTEIIEAKAQVFSSGLVRTTDLGPQPIEDINYMFIGFTGQGNWEVVGSIEGAAEGGKVVDFTNIVQTMFNERSSGKYLGYSVLYVPVDITFDSGTDLESLLPTEPPPNMFTPVDGHPCGGFHHFVHAPGERIKWDGAIIGEVFMKIKYPDSEFERTLLMPRLPSMA